MAAGRHLVWRLPPEGAPPAAWASPSASPGSRRGSLTAMPGCRFGGGEAGPERDLRLLRGFDPSASDARRLRNRLGDQPSQLGPAPCLGYARM